MKRLHLVLILIYLILMIIGAFTRVKANPVALIKHSIIVESVIGNV
jgi:hypothetical protein